ncbi:hypothetical protein AK812_SmicGene37170 [Symbiodinium microadriaticum]|uniref:Uncharacterized protein n=1 Tax=Symbiodinium microadriaticum TaxID=2951 RepID=A0A1Q9CH70_SYMMI|nr:hypothetical protein AK812_SmicGene37170 [Symbiodinium microadriaticum]
MMVTILALAMLMMMALVKARKSPREQGRTKAERKKPRATSPKDRVGSKGAAAWYLSKGNIWNTPLVNLCGNNNHRDKWPLIEKVAFYRHMNRAHAVLFETIGQSKFARPRRSAAPTAKPTRLEAQGTYCEELGSCASQCWQNNIHLGLQSAYGLQACARSSGMLVLLACVIQSVLFFRWHLLLVIITSINSIVVIIIEATITVAMNQ